MNFTKQFLGSGSDVSDCVRVLNNLSSNLADIFGETAPLEGAVLLQKVVLASGSNQVRHTLGKKLTGWMATRVRASATLYDLQDSQTLPQTYLTLVASAPVTVDLVVF